MLKNTLLLIICLGVIAACNINRNNCDLHFKSPALKKISCNNFFIPNITDLKTALDLDTLQLHPGEYGNLPDSVIELSFTAQKLRIKDYQLKKIINKQGTDIDSIKQYYIFYYDADCAFDNKNSTIALSYIEYEAMRGVPTDKLEYPGKHVYNVVLHKSKPDVLLIKKK